MKRVHLSQSLRVMRPSYAWVNIRVECMWNCISEHMSPLADVRVHMTPNFDFPGSVPGRNPGRLPWPDPASAEVLTQKNSLRQELHCSQGALASYLTELDAADAVVHVVEPRAERADAHDTRNHDQNRAARTRFGRQPNLQRTRTLQLEK